MTPKQIELVQQTWAQVAPIAEAAAELFYGRLFIIAPGVRPLFKGGDMAAQGRKLMMMISYAVKGLNRVEALLPGLQALGERHAGYGVRDEHYAAVGEALLWTLRQGLKEAFTAEVEQAWAAAYAVLSGAMRSQGERHATRQLAAA
jgi:hemoglobin-like flavoprotein